MAAAVNRPQRISAVEGEKEDKSRNGTSTAYRLTGGRDASFRHVQLT